MNLGKLLKGIAPLAAKVIGSAHPLAGMAVNVVADALGLDTAQSPEAVQREVEASLAAGDPGTLAKLREVDAGLKVRMAEIGYDEKRLQAELIGEEMRDVQSARQSADKRGHAPHIAFTVMLSLIIMAAGSALFLLDIPEANKAVAGTFLGVLIREWADAMNFWFGSKTEHNTPENPR